MAKKPLAPSDLADKFMLRMPDGMRDQIANAAKANKRSMNTEIIARLEESFDIRGRGNVFGVAVSIPEEDRREAVLLAEAMEEFMRRKRRVATGGGGRTGLKDMHVSLNSDEEKKR